MTENGEKERNRDYLILLLNEDPDWYQKPDTERYRQITALGRQIFQQDSKSNTDKIDEQTYLTLVHYGYTFSQIAMKFDVSKGALHRWRQQHGYIKNKKVGAV